MKITNTDSQTISILRFPLALLVVFCHLNPCTTTLASTDFSLWSLIGITNAIEIAFSYVIGHTAVPGFFLISGFLFFIGLDSWNWCKYWTKIKKRIYTLLIPYLSWIILSIISFIIYYIVIDFRQGDDFQKVKEFLSTINLESFWSCNVWGGQKTDWLGNPTPSSGPFVSTLWFIRDLIVVSALAPFFYLLIKKLRIWVLFLLLLCYVSKIWIQIPGFSVDACFYFGVGAYLSVNEMSLSFEVRKYRRIFYLLAIITFPLCLFFGGLKYHMGNLIFPIWAIAFVGTYTNWARLITETKKWTISPILIQSCMFIYALHALPIAKIGSPLAWIGYKLSLLFKSFVCHELLSYFTTPIVTIGFCIVAFYVIVFFTPIISKILTGKDFQKAETKL